MSFYVGQKVVCVKTHSAGVTRAGQVFIVRAVMICTCGHVTIDVGSVSYCSQTLCALCHRTYDSGDRWPEAASRFRPIEDLTTSLAETEVKRQVIERPDHVNEPQTC